MSAYDAPPAVACFKAASAASARTSSTDCPWGKISAQAGTLAPATRAPPAMMNSRRETGGTGMTRNYIAA
jgi:hypothetical protein